MTRPNAPVTQVALVAVALAGCRASPKLSVAELEDPATCASCHPHHFAEWSGSMHAYASDDPVFVAMNRRGQREAQLGVFCVRCHAPMAVALGLTDGTSFDPATLPARARGVTCYFCHDVAKIVGDHNNGLELALDDTMRGGVSDPIDTTAHRSSFDALMASSSNDSQMCGSCHDVVTPRGVALERSYQEWKSTIFAAHDPGHELPLTCSGCHMKSEPQVSEIAQPSKSRPNSFHEHLWPGIVQALTPFPGTDAQASAIARDLDPALTIVGAASPGASIGGGGICVSPDGGGVLTVRIDTRGTGHMWPTGAAQDRRAWLEVIAYDASDRIVFASGTVADDQDPEDLADPHLYSIWDRAAAADGSPAHMFWDVATVQSKLLRPPVTIDPTDPAFDHSSTARYAVGPIYGQFDHVTARVRIRTLSHALLRQLVASGDLDPSIAARSAKTLDIAGASRHWTKAAADAVTPFSGCVADPFQ
ncbi:MAG TPA: multiheme c-type cytochrome [Kofleriaceae bacterium]|nr:multiheme c-type cytochrome [Kofleriaceae bacterium]